MRSELCKAQAGPGVRYKLSIAANFVVLETLKTTHSPAVA